MLHINYKNRMNDEGWLIDKESGIRYKEPDDSEKCVWYVNYVADSRTENGVYVMCYASIGPMIYANASRIFDIMDDRGFTMCKISKISMSATPHNKPQGYLQ